MPKPLNPEPVRFRKMERGVCSFSVFGVLGLRVDSGSPGVSSLRTFCSTGYFKIVYNDIKH